MPRARSFLRSMYESWSSPIGFAAVADGSDLDCVFVCKIEENPVIATAKAKAGERRLELLYVPDAAGQIAVHAVENLYRSLAVDGAQISSGLYRPINRDPRGHGRFGHFSFTNVIYPGQTRAGCLRGERPLLARLKRGSARSLPSFRW